MSVELLSRRTVLRGVGASLALPMLDIMSPTSALAAKGGAAGAAGAAAPVRMAYVFFPNGAIMPDWKPKGGGASFELSPTLSPLQSLKDDLLVFSGLTHDKARANGDGAGDHARCSAAFLTASQPRKTAGADIHVGQSVDQVAAERIGKHTRFPSLEIATDPGRNAGSCDSGYSCAYSHNISWRSPSQPMAKEVNPRLLYERLFGTDEDKLREQRERKKRNLYRRSILDLVAEDATSLKTRLGTTDKRKVDEYFTAVREIEQRIARVEKENEEGLIVPPDDFDKPEGIPRGDNSFQTHVRLMMDLMVLAFQTDSTRICTFMMASAGSNRSYREIGVNKGHHYLSHHRNDDGKVDDIKKIDRFHVEQYAYLINRLKTLQEGDGTMLDNCMVMYGSGISDGNRHHHHDLPVVMAGRAGGVLRTGRHLNYPKDTPLANLLVTMLDRVGITDVESFGDSTGRLSV